LLFIYQLLRQLARSELIEGLLRSDVDTDANQVLGVPGCASLRGVSRH
jgi:hypothetical protein